MSLCIILQGLWGSLHLVLGGAEGWCHLLDLCGLSVEQLTFAVLARRNLVIRSYHIKI